MATEDSEGSGNIWYATTVMGACHYTFVQTRNMYNTQNEL